MLPKIPPQLLDVYRPLSPGESFYLRTRWRLCPFESIESLLPKMGKILDFGCGYGILTNFLAFKGPSRSVIGIDLNKNRIRVAERSTKNRKNVKFINSDIEGLDIDQYDAVVMTDVLHHIKDDSTGMLLDKVYSCLRNGGTLIILDVDKTPFLKFCFAYLVDKLLNRGSRLYYRSAGKMQHLLEKIPLRIEKVIQVHKGLPLSDIIYVCRKGSLST